MFSGCLSAFLTAGTQGEAVVSSPVRREKTSPPEGLQRKVFYGIMYRSFSNAKGKKCKKEFDDLLRKTGFQIKADEKVKSSIILEIMDAAQDAHYKKLIVAGEPLNKKEQRELEEGLNNADNTSLNSNTLNGATTSLPSDSAYEDWSN